MATNATAAVERALKRGFASKRAGVTLWIEKSDYKDFIRMYVVSDYFRGKTEKKRLDDIYAMMDSFGAGDAIDKVSLCIAMTTDEYDKEFGRDTWIANLDKVYRYMKRRPKLHRLARSHSRE